MAKVLGVGAALAILTISISASFHTQTASAYPSKAQDCTACHGSGTVSGTVTATPSTATPAAGAAYTVPINISMNAGDTGYWIANSDAAGTTGTSVVFGGGPGSTSLMYPVVMTAPAAAGTYYYKVWGVRGPNNASGQANFALYNITVGSAPAGAHITAVAPTHGLAGSTITISGTDLGTAGTVTIGGLTATTSAWSATSITATVPALAAGAANVIVTPIGGSASNTVTYTVDALAPPAATGPVVSLSAKMIQKAGKLVTIVVSCPGEACTATATGMVNVPGAGVAKRFKLGKATKAIAKGGRAVLRLKVPLNARKAITRALRGGKKVTAKITVTARDAAGNATTKRRTIKLRR